MVHSRRQRPAILAVTVLGLAALLSPTLRSAEQPEQEELVQARFETKQDALGLRWDFNVYGMVGDGTNDCFDNGLELRVNGSMFQGQQQLMTGDATEYVLRQKIGSLNVTRRMKLMSERSVVRYVEIIENTDNAPAQVNVEVRSRLGGNCSQVLTSSGQPFAGTLDKKDVGIIAVQTNTRPSVMFLVCGRRSKCRPTIQNQGNLYFIVSYALTLKPRETAALVHLVAQRTGVDVAKAADVFEPFYKNGLIKPGIPKQLRGTIANFRSSVALLGMPAPGGALEPVLAVVDEFGLERGKNDVAALPQQAVLKGTAACRILKVRTRFGEAQLALEDVALIVGGAGVGRPTAVYLRNGEILSGQIDAEGLELTTETGFKFALRPAGFDILVLHAAEKDGHPSDQTGAYVQTFAGDRIALSAAQPITLQVVTPWGPLEVSQEEMHLLVSTREPQPIHRLVLKDGSRLPVILKGARMSVQTGRFGPVELEPAGIYSFVPTGSLQEGEGEEEGFSKPHCLVIGENVVAGMIDVEALHVVSALGVTAVDPRQVYLMERRYEENSRQVGPVFDLALKDGSRLAGSLQERALPLKCGRRTLQVPVSQVQWFRQPEFKPEGFFEW